jgi:hypothetical protein
MSSAFAIQFGKAALLTIASHPKRCEVALATALPSV